MLNHLSFDQCWIAIVPCAWPWWDSTSKGPITIGSVQACPSPSCTTTIIPSPCTQQPIPYFYSTLTNTRVIRYVWAGGDPRRTADIIWLYVLCGCTLIVHSMVFSPPIFHSSYSTYKQKYPSICIFQRPRHLSCISVCAPFSDLNEWIEWIPFI